METLQALKNRRSVRKFKNTPVPKETILQILDCARFAPTARNVQPWDFIIISDLKIREEISRLAPNAPFVKDAPACIAVICKDTKYYLEDGCAATMNLLTSAFDLGLGACWVAGDKKDYCQQILDMLRVPAGYNLVSLIALGFSAEKAVEVPKHDLGDLIHWEKF